MPLSTPAPRRLQHTRQVKCVGYKRDDGLWDIEGHLCDIKSYNLHFTDRTGGMVPAGEPLHEMSLRITVDLDLNILDAEAAMDHTPFACCPDITPAYKKLIGVQIAQGFQRKVRELLGGVHGCVHLLELLGPMATTAFQTTHNEREELERWHEEGGQPPPMLDTCHTLARNGGVVKTYLPHHFKAPGQDSE